MRILIAFAGLLATFLLMAASEASVPSEEARRVARAMGDEGNEFLARGEYEKALDRFTQALAIVDAPTLAIRQAECLERMGRWVEAWEPYSAIAQQRLGPDAPTPFIKARQTARHKAIALDQRIPRLVVEVAGHDLQGAALTLDGRRIVRALWGVVQRVNPGVRELRLRHGSRVVLETVTIQEGEERRVMLELKANLEPKHHPGLDHPPSGSISSRTWGWGAVAVGAASILAGGALWGMAKSRGNELKEDGCAAGSCPAHLSSELDDYEQLRTGSYVGIGVGFVGLASGTALLLLPSDDEPQEARKGITPWAGVGQVGFSGTF